MQIYKLYNELLTPELRLSLKREDLAIRGGGYCRYRMCCKGGPQLGVPHVDHCHIGVEGGKMYITAKV